MRVLDHPRYRRRRRRALAGVAAVAALAGVAAGAGSAEEEEPLRAEATAVAAAPAAELPPGARRAAVAAVPIERQAGSLVILRFVGTSVPGYVREALREGRAGGAILFRDNLSSPAQLRRLTRALHRAAGGRALVAVDQEGGDVRVVPWIGPERSAARQAAAGAVRADSRAAGRALRAAGITVVLAPVADVPSVAGAAVGGRAFASEATAVARAVAAAVRGFRAAGVLPTPKHFPGLGGATVNTDDGPSEIARSRRELGDDLRPFRAAIAAGAPLVMLGHARYPALDGDRIASQSRAIATDLLRGELGFRGAAMTDSMEAAAVTATGSLERAAERSLEAGADLLLCTGQGSSLRIHRALTARARRDPAFAARVREAAGRVAALPGAAR